MVSLRVAFWCLALALFAVALVAPSTFFLFVGIKAYWFRLWVSAAAAAFLWWAGFLATRASDSVSANGNGHASVAESGLVNGFFAREPEAPEPAKQEKPAADKKKQDDVWDIPTFLRKRRR